MEIKYTNLVFNITFWVIFSFLARVIVEKTKSRGKSTQTPTEKHKTLLLFAVLFIPLGLVMDLVHELGHALWGTVMGGTLTYVKIAFFQIYPSLAITSPFVLGYTAVDGISSSLVRGVFLLGGSLTTNLASWLIALILIKTSLGETTRVALWTLGLFGLLDLPFYVLFPQMGLQHWIFLGGRYAEPLIGARLMGISDALFYLTVSTVTLSLAFLYVRTFESVTIPCKEAS